MPSIKIFGIYYAPEPSGNAPYTTGVAEHLAAHGWDVEMVTGMPHYPEWVKQDAPMSSVVNGVTVTRHTHYVPSNPTTMRRGAMDATWTAATSRHALRRLDTDIVMGISPTLAGASVAVAAARRSGVPCLLWFQDLMGQAAEQSGIKGGDRVAGAVRKTEHILARQADSVVVCSEGYRGYFENAGVSPHNVHVVRNWSLLPPGTVSKRTARAQFDFRADQTVVVHSGNMGAKQGLEVVLEAAAGAPDVLFVLQGNGSERVSLEAAVDARNLTNVEFLPSLSPEDLVNLLRAADVLLLTQRASVTDMSLPSKLTAYIPAHTPIVASVSADSEAAALLDEAATGRVVEPGNAEVLVHAIRVAAVDPVSTTGDEARLFGSPAHFESLLEDLIR